MLAYIITRTYGRNTTEAQNTLKYISTILSPNISEFLANTTKQNSRHKNIRPAKLPYRLNYLRTNMRQTHIMPIHGQYHML